MCDCGFYIGDCIVCKREINSCCGSGKIAKCCYEEFCRECYNQRSNADGKFDCPVCSFEVITEKHLREYLLAIANLNEQDAKEGCRKWFLQKK